MNSIRGIIFDFGNVLCTFDIALFLQRLSTLTAVPVSRLQAVLESSLDLSRQYESGFLSSEDFFQKICARGTFSLPIQEFREAYCSIFRPMPRIFDLIRRLKPRYALGLLSNTNEWHFECAIKTVEVFHLFDAITLSYLVKSLKPSEPIYRDMLARLALLPEQCVYIDDIQENADAAARLGIHAIRYRSYEELVSSLAHVGVCV